MKAILMVVLASGLLCSCATPPKVNSPPMLSRAEWQAAPPVLEMKTHRIDHITIHHTAVKQNPQRSLADKLKSLQKFSQNPGTLGSGKAKPAWPDVPYHYYIDCHGQIGEAREVKFVGDTNTAYDPTGHALVVLEGNFEEEQPTAAQLAALREMVAWLAARYQVAPDRVGGHQDFAQTLCPGKNLQALLPELRQAVRPSREN
jgi:N-acetyl-anhydromuramyl-L-alanine amidase AmpD